VGKIILAIVFFVAVGFGIWFVVSNTGEEEVSEVATETQAVTEEKQDSLFGTGSLASLMNKDDDIECTFKNTDEMGTSEGLFKYSKGLHRVDIKTVTAEGSYAMSIVNNGDRTYMWGDGPEGKMAIVTTNETVEVDEEAAEFAESHQDAQAFDMGQGVSYECKKWSVNSSVFNPPSDIEFVDMQTMFEDMMEGLPEGIELPEGFEMPEGMPALE